MRGVGKQKILNALKAGIEEVKVKEEEKVPEERKVPDVEPPSNIDILKYSLPCFEIEEQEREESLDTNREEVIDTAPPQPIHALLSPRHPSSHRRSKSRSRSQLPPSPTHNIQHVQ